MQIAGSVTRMHCFSVGFVKDQHPHRNKHAMSQTYHDRIPSKVPRIWLSSCSIRCRDHTKYLRDSKMAFGIQLLRHLSLPRSPVFISTRRGPGRSFAADPNIRGPFIAFPPRPARVFGPHFGARGKGRALFIVGCCLTVDIYVSWMLSLELSPAVSLLFRH